MEDWNQGEPLATSYGWHILRMKIGNIIGTSQNVCIDADDLSGEWDPQHLVGIHPKGFMSGFGGANLWPRPIRSGTPAEI